jgi:pimeloyl-ACP methyl ester carboxylesterase
MNGARIEITSNSAETQLVTAAGVDVAHLDASDDLMIPPVAGHLMARVIPDAPIRIYADAGHGFLFVHPAEVAADINAFLPTEQKR